MNIKKSWNQHWKSRNTIERLKTINTAYPEVVQLLLDLTNEQSNCIELGCGSGTYAIELLANNRKCLASDFSEKALELAKIKGREIYNIGVTTQLVDAYNIPYPEASFDLVFSDGMIEHLDILKVLKESRRVLKSNGWVVAKVPSGSFLYKIVYHLLSPIENRPNEIWLSKKEWQKKFIDCGYKNINVLDCGSALVGFAMRIQRINKLLKYLPRLGKIYFIIKAQK